MENEIVCRGGLEHDRMNMDCLQWQGITFWGMPLTDDSNEYGKFEVYDLKHGLTYKLIVGNPYEAHHSSGWEILLAKFGDLKPLLKLTKDKHFNKATFGELFAAIVVLNNEDYDPYTTDHARFKDMKKKWKKLAKNLPQWLDATIEGTEKSKAYDS